MSVPIDLKSGEALKQHVRVYHTLLKKTLSQYPRSGFLEARNVESTVSGFVFLSVRNEKVFDTDELFWAGCRIVRLMHETIPWVRFQGAQGIGMSFNTLRVFATSFIQMFLREVKMEYLTIRGRDGINVEELWALVDDIPNEAIFSVLARPRNRIIWGVFPEISKQTTIH